MNTDLKQPCKMFRANAPQGSNEHKIENEGGVFGAGVIYGVSLIQKGEALGHGMWVDEVMLQQVAEHLNATEKGVKSRWTHPMLSDDGMGKYLGRLKDARVEGDKTLADIHFAESAHNSPDGNFASYLMKLAKEDPEAFGMSIVFEGDYKAEQEFKAQHLNEDGYFVSPDKENKHNYTHARIAKLRAADFVDEPAANEDGLFSKALKAGDELNKIGQFALGLSEDLPQVSCFDIDPARIRKFAEKFLSAHGLEIVKKQDEQGSEGNELSETENIQTETEVDNPEEQLSEDAEINPQEEKQEEQAQESPETANLSENEKHADLKKFTDAFGMEQGAKWLLEGKTFSEAQEELCKKLKSENENLKADLEKAKNLSSVGGEPLTFSPAPETEKKSVIRIK